MLRLVNIPVHVLHFFGMFANTTCVSYTDTLVGIISDIAVSV